MNLFLREAAKEDMDLLYEWANDSVVRQNAFHTEQIPYDTHRAWFVRTLADREVLQYILCDADRRQGREEIGQIRLSLKQDRAVIDYSIDKMLRQKGLGAKMILMAEEKLREKETDVIYCVGQVKYENTASARVFDKCGYDAEELEDYIEYTKRIK